MNATPWTLVKEASVSHFRSEASPTVHDRILLEQVRACYRHMIGAIFGGPLSVPLLVFLLWNNIDSRLLFGWGAVTLTCHVLGGTVLHYGFLNDPSPQRNVRKWNRGLYLLAAVLGVCWGSVGILFLGQRGFV